MKKYYRMWEPSERTHLEKYDSSGINFARGESPYTPHHKKGDELYARRGPNTPPTTLTNFIAATLGDKFIYPLR